MITVNKVCKTYRNGVVANHDISIEIEQGDVVGVVGENGAGKTTLMRIICGLSRQTSGDVVIGDLKPNSKREITAKLISFFNQKTVLLQSHRVFEIVCFTGIYRGLNKAESIEQASKLLEYFSLSDYSMRPLSELSGGQTKLTMLASAFIGCCPIMILDEPTNDLDPVNRWQLWDLIKEYHEKHNTTFVIVSHNISELETITHKAIILHEGRVADAGDIQFLKEKYSRGYRISLVTEKEPGKMAAKTSHADWPKRKTETRKDKTYAP